ncbi:type II toxin-antitoxin system RelE/ParE family toxin, partial [Salmonella enterica]|uniref:type II toxin-antitoxin system RelE/ParE family toxin n=1 Tax=Salmonella enterica TaxID=28901 RepID=UPI0034C5FD9F
MLKPLRLATAKTHCYRQSGNDWLTHRKESELVWMTYELEFDPRALKEWQKLGETVKKQFRKKLV